MIEYIKHRNEVLAIILRKEFTKEGANFFTAPDDPFQFGVLQYKKGKYIPPHRHIELKREINLVCEALFIQSGKVEVTFYDDNDKKITSTVLHAGDTILMEKLGHGFNLLEDSKIIEVKQGPYLGKDNDKKNLNL
jgi:cupin fold WbuC family metalloprotein